MVAEGHERSEMARCLSYSRRTVTTGSTTPPSGSDCATAPTLSPTRCATDSSEGCSHLDDGAGPRRPGADRPRVRQTGRGRGSRPESGRPARSRHRDCPCPRLYAHLRGENHGRCQTRARRPGTA
ncbi:hypothetical protein [Streptomyces sp. TP-A0874]|uniref:hypothetical protein n=1 Tax=Streptomyces sp. TP-A0874 TaxID=549819 RepID=UPI001FCD8FF5|nr:hypothetical protein [Streptomyces sp. TP-A0874]